MFDEVEKVAKCATKESVSITRDYDEMLNSYLAQSFKMTNDYNHIISYETIDDWNEVKRRIKCEKLF